jgi:hypothetical protein
MNIRVCAAIVQRGSAIAVAMVAVCARKSRRVRADAMIASNGDWQTSSARMPRA